jgi:hypothetical protein
MVVPFNNNAFVFMVSFELLIIFLNPIFNRPFNIFIFYISVSLPLILGFLVIVTKLKRGLERKKYIRRLNL